MRGLGFVSGVCVSFSAMTLQIWSLEGNYTVKIKRSYTPTGDILQRVKVS